MLGAFAFEAPINYIPKYHRELAEPSIRYLYKMILGHPQALCVFFTNNTYVAVVTEHSIIYTNIYKEKDVITYDFKKPILKLDLVPIGFIKTRIECVSVPTLPYRLFYSKEGKCAYIHNTWVNLEAEPEIDPNMSLYVELLKTEKSEGIYRDTTGKIHYLN